MVPYKDIYGDFIEDESTSYEDNKDVWKENMLQIARGLKKLYYLNRKKRYNIYANKHQKKRNLAFSFFWV